MFRDGLERSVDERHSGGGYRQIGVGREQRELLLDLAGQPLIVGVDAGDERKTALIEPEVQGVHQSVVARRADEADILKQGCRPNFIA